MLTTTSLLYNTIEFDKYFPILPSNVDKQKYINYFKDLGVPEGFKYNLSANTEWDTVEVLREKFNNLSIPN